MDDSFKVRDLIEAEKIQEYSPALTEYFEKGGTWQLLMNISDSELEVQYSMAYELYEEGKYLEATAAFTTLSLLNPYNIKHWIGLGASKQMFQDYESAILAYTFASLLEEQNPIPVFHAAQCQFALNQTTECAELLKRTIALAGDNSLYKPIKDESLRLLNAVKKIV